MKPNYEQLRDAFCDMLDGDHQWYDIQHNTGLPEARCKEISNMFTELREDWLKSIPSKQIER